MSLSKVEADAPPFLHALPLELRELVASFLPNRDIKNLRLTCKSLAQVLLRLNRVFISPNHLNIEVFKAIAEHEVYRHRVLEIIYDDARFEPAEQYERDYADPRRAATRAHAVCTQGRRYHLVGHSAEQSRWAALLSHEEACAQYKEIWDQQQVVLQDNSDYFALKYGLTRFSRLQTVTITTATHGQCPLSSPYFHTPMTRSLPPGFFYPSHTGWPAIYKPINDVVLDAEPWVTQQVKGKWRGFQVVTHAMARHIRDQQKNGQTLSQTRMVQFSIDNKQALTGLNCRIFERRSQEYADLVTILRQPGLLRFDLSLYVTGHQKERWQAFKTPLLRFALSQARDMQHMSFTTNCYPPDYCGSPHNTSTAMLSLIPLRTIFPIDTWTNLRHFGLVRFHVDQADLIGFLAALPPTLRSVELSYLYFIDAHGSYHACLAAIRQQLDWRERPHADRPKIIVSVDNRMDNAYSFPKYSVDTEVEKFVYGKGPNPFKRMKRTHVKIRVGVDFIPMAPEDEWLDG